MVGFVMSVSMKQEPDQSRSALAWSEIKIEWYKW